MLTAGVPPASTNVTVTILSAESPTVIDPQLTINLTWFQNKSHCIVVYQVEVNTANRLTIENSTSEYAVLSLQIGKVYSLRVRGIDTGNRLGEWSTKFTFNATGNLIDKAHNTPFNNIVDYKISKSVPMMYCSFSNFFTKKIKFKCFSEQKLHSG